MRNSLEERMTLRDSGNPEVPTDLRLPDEEEFAGAASHPITAKALQMMMTRRPITASEVAEAMGKPLAEVSRHLAGLRRDGFISVGETKEVEGRAEPLYEGPFAPFLDKEEWAELSPGEQRFQLRQIANLLLGDIDAALEAETLDAWPDFHFCRMPFRMDERGWEEVREIYDAALMKAVQIREEAAERLRREGEAGRRGTLGQALFELPSAE